MEKITDKFLRYVSYDTQSDENSDSQPSTFKQLVLLRQLVDELKALGIENASIDKDGYVMASIDSNVEGEVPAIGFIAHVDTSPDAPGDNIHPKFVENYDGSDIPLGDGRVLTVAEFPELLRYKGQTLITTDGTTLLGADDKAGVAEIMCAAEYIMTHPDFKHGPVKIAFTPDEEIGRGVVAFDVKRFGADFAYTMDGGMIGELEYENFNAASAKIHIQGRNIHPGYAKNKMINSMLVAMELNAMLPVEQRPEYTEGYEGFIHLISFKGTVEESDIAYIIRDHDAQLFERKKEMVQQCVDFINKKYGNVAVAEIKNQYRNMREMVEPHFEVVETAIEALKMAGIEPKVQPIRGGTDGANLSFMGLPCPNIFAGGHNFHGRLEFVPVESMEKASQVILNILEIFRKKSK
ncbi:MAG: peptidase T [Bacteroidales bacterium]|jgi:tripeptide aminopeptidase|nr:peptidase T [Bacteroidales bacterium]